MTDDKIEGTILLEGLLQGRCPDDEEFVTRLKDWAGLMRKFGLAFSPEVNAGQFSILPDSQPVPTKLLGDAPDHTLQEALDQLFQAFPDGQPGQLFSTLRSREFRPGEEVQTLYVASGGAFKTQSRSIEAKTTPPPEPIPLKSKLQIAGVGLLGTVVLLGLLFLIPPVREQFFDVLQSVKSFDVEEFTVQVGPYAEYLTVTVDPKRSNRNGVTLVLKRKPNYPSDDAALTDAVKQADDSLTKRLALESLARGSLRVELYDGDGKLVRSGDLSLYELRDTKKEEIEVIVPFPSNIRIARLKLSP